MPAIALDTNVLAYAEGIERHPDDRPKVGLSRQIVRGLMRSGGWSAPAQALAELHAVLVRRGRQSPLAASLSVRRLTLGCLVIPTLSHLLDEALVLAADHHLQIYDAIIVAAAADAGCELLLSEDLHDGFTWRSVTVTNPFRQAPDQRVAQLLPTQP